MQNQSGSLRVRFAPFKPLPPCSILQGGNRYEALTTAKGRLTQESVKFCLPSNHLGDQTGHRMRTTNGREAIGQ
jgi:hypothetical protein